MFNRRNDLDEPTVIDFLPAKKNQTPSKQEGADLPPRADSGEMARTIPLDAVSSSPHQPRKRPITKADVTELMVSIAAAGQTTPILVTPSPDAADKYVVHAGHRRCAALRFLGRATVLAIVKNGLNDRDARQLALADNLGREDLSAYEQALALNEYADAFGLGFDAAAVELGVQTRTAARLKAILGGSKELLELLRENAIAAKPADLLVKLEARIGKRSLSLADKYVNGAVSLAELEAKLRAQAKERRAVRAAAPVELSIDDEIASLRIRVVRPALSDAVREQLRAALAEFATAVGIARVDAIVALPLGHRK